MSRTVSAVARRSLLVILTALASPAIPGMATASPAGADADAGLIHLAGAYGHLSREYNAAATAVSSLSYDHPDFITADQEQDRICAQQNGILDAITGAPPTTLAGLQALASALVEWDQELLRKAQGGDTGRRLTALLVRSLLDMPSAAA